MATRLSTIRPGTCEHMGDGNRHALRLALAEFVVWIPAEQPDCDLRGRSPSVIRRLLEE